MIDHDCTKRAIAAHVVVNKPDTVARATVRVFGIVYVINWLAYMVFCHAH
jgi:hypothetical protein